MTKSTQPGAEPNLLDIVFEAWRAKRLILSGMVLAALAAAGFIFAANPHYKAQMLVSPANPMNGAEVSSLLADDNLFALRYLVQRVGVANSSDFMRFENIYAGPAVASYLLKDPQIRAGLEEDLTYKFSTPRQDWTPEELSEYIKERVRVEPVGGTSMRRMVYMHPRRAFGTYLLHNIHRMSDELIRLRIREDASKRIEYLEDAIAKTYNPEHKRALTTLLLEQERLRMLVSIETPYAAAVVEAPSADVKPRWPDIPFVFAAFIVAGALAGFFIYSFKKALAHERPRRADSGQWYKSDSSNANDPDGEEKDGYKPKASYAAE